MDYLMCPAGLLDVVYSALADNIYKSGYWTVREGNMKILKFSKEENLTYIYSVKPVGFEKEVRLKIMTPSNTFDFDIVQIDKIMYKDRDYIEMLTFVTRDGNSFFLLADELEEKVYYMNHLPKSDVL